MKLSIEQIYQAALGAGFTPDQATTWTAIALAESGGMTTALNDRGEHSVGLWQINIGVHADKWGDLHDPVNNAKAAYEISRGGTDMRPWTVTHASNAGTARDYRSYLDDVSAVTGYAGDGRGVEGYGAPLLDPLPPSGPTGVGTMLTATPTGSLTGAPVDLLTHPGSATDADADGLTDAFEEMVGSRADLADSDSDGLSDAYETVVTRTGLLTVDTDADTVTDASEAALGTSGITWDTDSDGASDGAELDFGKDPLVAETGVIPGGSAATVLPAGATPVTTTPTLTTPTMTTLTAPTAGPPVTGTGGSLAEMFIQQALAQKGDTYVFGAEADLADADPETFDCSELTQWAADQVGVTIPDGAMYQYLELKDQSRLMSVEEALRTPGALLFYFSDEPTPGGGRPSSAHVAISLGNGQTIEAKGSSYGVDTFDAGDPGERFNYAGMIPGMEAGALTSGLAGLAGTEAAGLTGPGTDPALLATTPDLDADDDGLSDAFEQMVGLDPTTSDSDGDRIADAEEALGGPQELTDEQVAAALAEQGLEGDLDADSDGLSNRYEIRHGLDVHAADTDSDTVSDSSEVALGTDPTRLDTDADGVTDAFELDLGTDPLTAGDPTQGWGYEDVLGAPDTGAPDTLAGTVSPDDASDPF
jgi:cell wall-associated NlpC family hydrolase